MHAAERGDAASIEPQTYYYYATLAAYLGSISRHTELPGNGQT
jgi:hypothetical protein